MLRAGWKSLLARKLRLVLSASAIVLGVAFVAGSLIFTDTLGRSFDGIMSGSVGDVIVQPAGTQESGSRGGGQTTAAVPGSLVTRLRGMPGAARVDGQVASFGVFVIGKNGKLIGGTGAPGIAINHTGAPAAHGVDFATLDYGRWPTKAGEVVLDRRTAETSGYLLNEDVPFVSAGRRARLTATLVGVARYGNGGLAGATLSMWETSTAQRLFQEQPSTFASLWVTARPGTTQEALRAAVVRRLPTGYEAVTGDAAAAKAQTGIQKALGFIDTFLLVFAAIALVVGVFLIFNTFSILVAQRSRELALFRALGASRSQVARSVLLEAAVVGTVGAAIGLVAGIGLALGIKAAFGRLGLELTSAAMVVAPRTIVAALLVGVVVTLVAAYVPARRAGKVAPVAAMRDDVVMAESGLTRRLVTGLVLGVAGVGVLAEGLWGSPESPGWWVGAGMFFSILAAAALSPFLGRPVVAGLGAGYRRLWGSVGTMAEQNAQRNPRRTGATASALMIGVSLVALLSILGASMKATVDVTIEKEFVADYIVSNAIGMPFSAQIGDDIAKVPGVRSVARVRYTRAVIDGDRTYPAAIDPATVAEVAPLRLSSGSLAGLGPTTFLVEEGTAKETGLRLGQKATVKIGPVTKAMTVAGTYRKSELIGSSYVFTHQAFVGFKVPVRDSFDYVVREPGADPVAVRRALGARLKDLPLVTVKDQGQFADEQRAPVDQLLYFLYALLGLAVVIGILGIVNTMSLSVVERTREIGLLRAVGLSRRQLRSMLRLESTAIAVLGALLGVGLGLAFGVALQRSQEANGLTELVIPWGQLGLVVAVAAVVGVLAALWPGRRAARLDVLRAITAE